MAFLRIVLMSVAAAVVYGIVQDQINARICVEYFTIGHPPLFGTEDPTALAFGWGILARWWVGVLLGVPLTWVARPKLSARDLVKPLLPLMGGVGMVACVAGSIGYYASKYGWVWLVGPLASRVPPEKHTAFVADLWAHGAAYLAGFVGGIGVCVWTWKRRNRLLTQLPRPVRGHSLAD
jgi:hypothetical protein